MKVIGITGGIGSGKSTVAGIIRDLGGKVLDADIIARRIMGKGSLAYEQVVECFGTDILEANGEVNRKKLATIVFKDREKIKKLNEITHKHVADSIYRKLNRIRAAGRIDFVALDAPIPAEKGFLDVVDEVWVVTADRDIRMERILKRGGLSSEEAFDRINSQPEDDKYRQIADVVIENNGTPEELEKKVAKLFIRKKTG